MRYTSKFQRKKAQALGSLRTFDLATNWLLEAMAPALGSLGTLPLKHLKTNKVAETDARPRQNGNYFTKLTPNDVNRQSPACHYVFFSPLLPRNRSNALASMQELEVFSLGWQYFRYIFQ